jgi:type III pantothenate kinase
MILAVDIGNTSTKFGLFERDTLTSKFSIPTKRDATADDIKDAVGDRLVTSIEAAIVCSVVPPVESAIRSFLKEAAGADLTFVTNSFDFGFKINYEPLESLGTDRLVNAYAAVENYGAPCIVCSLGTATTIDAVSADREFLGGIIAPGMDAMAEALHLKATGLPKVEITDRPNRAIGNSTGDAIRHGVYFGYVSMVEGLIMRIRTETGISRVVGTGGNVVRLADEFSGIMTVDANLTIDGLNFLFHRSKLS